MTTNSPRNASRAWVRRHLRPRTATGAWARGWELWTRSDGQSRWVHAWTPESEPERHLSPREWLALFLLASLLWAAIIVAVTVW
jgi:hypothetical protein